MGNKGSVGGWVVTPMLGLLLCVRVHLGIHTKKRSRAHVILLMHAHNAQVPTDDPSISYVPLDCMLPATVQPRRILGLAVTGIPDRSLDVGGSSSSAPIVLVDSVGAFRCAPAYGARYTAGNDMHTAIRNATSKN
jgi:hypothetical protein